MTNSAEMFSLAWRYHQTGSLPQAEQLYRQVLQAEPNHADAWCFLGAACQGQGKIGEAETCYRQSVRFFPGHISALNCLGVLLAEQGKMQEATALFKQAVQMDPRSPEILNNLGLAYARLGQPQDAINTYQEALRLKPDYAQAYYNLGLTLNAQGRREEAIGQFRNALRLEANYPDAFNDLGNALSQIDQFDDAVASYQQALRLRPNFAEAHYNLAVVFGKMDRHHAELFHYEQAVRFKPDYAEAHLNMGNVMHGLWRFDEAIDCYLRALKCKPGFADAMHGLGGIYLRHGRLERAVDCFNQALQLDPESPVLTSNLLFCMNYDPEIDPETVFAEHCRYDELCKRLEPLPPCNNDRSPDRRLRIGYVSPDLRFHALARYLEPVLIHHDPQQVEVFCYAEVAKPDDVSRRLQKLAHAWHSTCGETDLQVAQKIRDDKIDILVDLAGHTANHRLCAFAMKPAPIQATWLGYMNTTGLKSVDYRLTDDVLDPPGGPVRDSEELFRLSDGMCCFAAPLDAPAVTALPALERGHLTFGSLHNLFKFNSRVYDVWSQLLKAIPKSRLLMYRHTLTGSAKDDIYREFTSRGVAEGQLDLRQGTDKGDYLKIYEEIDISLDTFPYTGGVTTCESLWMGVPVLSLCGVRPAGRNSAAILARVGLADWAVATPEEYVRLAERWAGQVDELAALRGKLRDRMTATICDAKHFTHTLEEAYRTMWQRWCAKPVQE